MHVVVENAGIKPETMMAQFKSWATRRLREEREFLVTNRIWTHHGSTRYLWTREQVETAATYVTDGQGPDSES